MLHDNITIDQIVDSEAALEFMKEATKLSSSRELEDIGQRLNTKGDLFRHILGPEHIKSMTEDEFKRIIQRIFSVRRKSNRLIKTRGYEPLRQTIENLLYGSDPVEKRFNVFVSEVNVIEEKMTINLASELLHYSNPGKYGLWTNWVWDPITQTGAMPLVMQNDVDLQGSTHGDVYMKVCQATNLVDIVSHSIGFSGSAKGLFGTDIFLACVYAVYMYTIFRVKLSQEFNRILPELPELTQRVLGVHKVEMN